MEAMVTHIWSFTLRNIAQLLTEPMLQISYVAHIIPPDAFSGQENVQRIIVLFSFMQLFCWIFALLHSHKYVLAPRLIDKK